MSELTDMREKRVAEQGEIIAKLRAALHNLVHSIAVEVFDGHPELSRVHVGRDEVAAALKALEETDHV